MLSADDKTTGLVIENEKRDDVVAVFCKNDQIMQFGNSTASQQWLKVKVKLCSYRVARGLVWFGWRGVEWDALDQQCY